MHMGRVTKKKNPQFMVSSYGQTHQDVICCYPLNPLSITRIMLCKKTKDTQDSGTTSEHSSSSLAALQSWTHQCLQSACCSAGKWLVLAGLRWLALARTVSQSPADQLRLVPVTDTGSKSAHMGLQDLFRTRLRTSTLSLSLHFTGKSQGQNRFRGGGQIPLDRILD